MKEPLSNDEIYQYALSIQRLLNLLLQLDSVVNKLRSLTDFKSIVNLKKQDIKYHYSMTNTWKTCQGSTNEEFEEYENAKKF